MSYDLGKEVKEAIDAGSAALLSLRKAQEELGHARNWGIVDMLGGGFLTDIFKHSKINTAQNCIINARHYLNQFQIELRDVAAYPQVDIEIGDFLTFADFFFDGIIADYMVQQKIADARRQVDEAIDRVEQILYQLNTITI
ncbi:MAG: hypothetical protein J6D02_07275 [Lachnospira sp.]|nr:hypothetical protein [Lachnospira sp.]